MNEDESKQIAQTAKALVEEASRLITLSNNLTKLIGHINDK